MDNIIRSTRLEIDLDLIKYNMKQLLDYSESTKILAVIKADAYSNGAVDVASTLMESGAWGLAVATINEALELRYKKIKAPLMILGFVDNDYLEYVVKYDLIQTIYNKDQALKLNEFGEKYNKLVNIHIKIDTGMNRLGFKPTSENLELIQSISNLEYINIQGIFSHFAESEIDDKSFTKKQYETFVAYITSLEKLGLKFEIKHISNWGGYCDTPEYNLDMVRLGVPLFGVYSNYELQKPKIDLKVTMKLKTKISNIKVVKEGESISYNRQYFCKSDRKIATIPVGYADGISQDMAAAFDFYIKDQSVKSVGKVCMDQIMLDITDVENVSLEDEVVVFDNRNQKYLSARNIANISKRVPKVYIENGKIVKAVDLLFL